MSNSDLFTEKSIKSGIARAVVSHPFDCTRIFMQNSNKSISTYEAMHSIFKRNGIGGFYKGITPFMGGNIFLLSIYSNAYYKFKNKHGSFLAGAIGGVSGSPIATFIEYYRSQYFSHSFNFQVKNCMHSLPIIMMRDSIGWGAFFMTFSKSKELCKDIPQPFQAITVGSISGLALWTSMFPLDTIKTRIQSGIDKSILDSITKCYKMGGIGKFWTGYVSCLLRAIPVNSVLVWFL